MPLTLVRSAAAAALGLLLAGCIDATIELDVLSESDARARITQVMTPDFYAMITMNGDEGEDEESFCHEGALVENADGSATCTLLEEGPFASLSIGADEASGVRFTSAGPGLVRVGFETADLAAEAGADDALDAETRQMMEAFFTGHAITIRIGGGELVETNMAVVGGRAEQVIPLLDLIHGLAHLPDELYAVIRP